MSEVTANLKLPLLYVGQAQKEITHNEALMLLDAVLSPTLSAELSVPPASLDEADAGKRWLVGTAASEAWVGHDGEIAYWTGDGWRFLVLPETFSVYRQDLGQVSVRIAGNWVSTPAIAEASGGDVVDLQARASISSILEFLRMTGQIPSAT